MKKLSKVISISLIIITTLFSFSLTVLSAETPNDNPMSLLEGAGQGAQYNVSVDESTVPKIIGQIVAIVLGFVGSIFFIMIIYSGFQWMTAGGNEEKVKQSKTRMINGIMGMVIVVAAYFITWLIKVTLLGS